jgi:hypothetical protein
MLFADLFVRTSNGENVLCHSNLLLGQSQQFMNFFKNGITLGSYIDGIE